MLKKKIIQGSAIVFLLLAILLSVPNTEWTDSTSVFGFISLVLGTSGSIVSVFIPSSYTYCFKEEEWQKDKDGSGYILSVKARTHGMGNSPQVQIFLMNGETYEEVSVASNLDNKGNVVIGANTSFTGKIIVS